MVSPRGVVYVDRPRPLNHHGDRLPRILVVDDDALARAVVSDAVRSLGYEVVTAAGGAQALAAFADSRFDLVVTDVRMPQVDGFDVARAWSLVTNFKSLSRSV
jgi:CheY-like chemotaxis protein